MTAPVDTFDELAALFLTEPDARKPLHEHERGEIVAELLLVGHLPVRGSLWIGPFADALARERGPTALVRLNEDEPSIELFRSPAFLAGDDGDAIDFAPLVRELSGSIGTWLIRPASAAAANLLDADRVTVLTAADEAATVALYKTLKELAEAAKAAGRAVPVVTLALAGCDREQARELVARVNRTASTYLGFEVRLGVSVPQIEAGIRPTGYRRFRGQTKPELRAIFEALRDAPVGARMQTATHGEATRGETVRGREPAAPWRAESSSGDFAWRGSTVAARVMAESGADQVKIAPNVRAAVGMAAPRASSRPSEPARAASPAALTDHVPGVSPLIVRCPGHEQIELAVDQAGRLHMIGWEANLRELGIAEAWARLHLRLISLASPQTPIDPAGRFVRHVFTGEPATVADLHGSGVQLHVLAPVQVEGQTGWYAAPLNAVAGG